MECHVLDYLLIEYATIVISHLLTFVTYKLIYLGYVSFMESGFRNSNLIPWNKVCGKHWDSMYPLGMEEFLLGYQWNFTFASTNLRVWSLLFYYKSKPENGFTRVTFFL